jgi:uncharacterized membrane protein
MRDTRPFAKVVGDNSSSQSVGSSGTTEANVRAVIALERETLGDRTLLQRVTDSVTAAVSSPAFIVAHLAWFAFWVGINTFVAREFDPYPFSLLTLLVSLEAILLTGFVLMSQDRMTKLADKRTHLDLQVNLLAEQELTAILRVVCLVADKAGVDLNGCDPNLDKLLNQTNVKVIADELTRELDEVKPEK